METLPSGACASSRATAPPSAARARSSPSACWRRSGTGLACRRPEGFSLRASPRTQDSGGTDEGWGPERDRDQRAPCGLGARDGRPPGEGGARSARGAGRGRGRLLRRRALPRGRRDPRAGGRAGARRGGRRRQGATAPGPRGRAGPGGGGGAGWQAIATARRLGGVVSAFDVRPAVKEQVESLGASFVAPEAVTTAAEAAGGYAAELGEDQQRRELELIHRHIREMDLVITTALIPGRPAPRLITGAMVRDMRSGAVIVDLAAEAGGNCELTRPDETVREGGVTVLGPLNLPATVPLHASQMYSRNLQTLLQHLVKDGALVIDLGDEITGAMVVTHQGEVRSLS